MAKHLLQTQSLRTQLDLVASILLWLSAFVFHGERPPASIELRKLDPIRGLVEFQEQTGVTLMTDKAGLQTVSDLPDQGSVFIDFLKSVYAGGKPALSWSEIVQANEYTLAAHEAAARHRVVQIGWKDVL